MPSFDTGVIVLVGITFFAAFVNGAIGYGFSSLTVPVALVFYTNRIAIAARERDDPTRDRGGDGRFFEHCDQEKALMARFAKAARAGEMLNRVCAFTICGDETAAANPDRPVISAGAPKTPIENCRRDRVIFHLSASAATHG